MTVISFFVPEEPFAKRRPRFGKGRVYTDPQTVAAEDAIRWYARRAMGSLSFLEGPLCLTTHFIFKPKNKDNVGKWHIGAGDADNYVKAVADAIIGVVFKDDRQIARGFVTKRWALAYEPEGTHVCVQTWEGDAWDI